MRVGTLMAQAPEIFTSLEEAIAFGRATSPRYTEAMFRHRVRHGTRPVPGGFAWKYDRALLDAVRSGKWRDPIDLWPLWRAVPCPSCSCAAPTPTCCLLRSPSGCSQRIPRLVEVAGAGHTVPGDQPAAFRALLDEFLAA